MQPKKILLVISGLAILSTLGFSHSAYAENSCAASFIKTDINRSFSLEGASEQRIIEKDKPIVWNDDASYIEAVQNRERLGQIRSYFSKRWDTQVYYTNTGKPDAKGVPPLVDPEAKAVFIFFHGSGTMKSSGANYIANMNALVNLGYSAISVDLPFHARGPRDVKFNNSNVFMEWVRSIVLEAKKSGLPIYLAGHSFGPDVVLEYITRYPKDVTGAVALSPAGFNKILAKWYQDHTSKMKFGGDVPPNDAGAYWAGTMSSQFLWAKGKLADPTIINPGLRVRVLSGNREEYVPAPVSAENGLPNGENIYDIRAPLQSALRNAVITIEPGIGHYLFEHVDAIGNNAVMREMLLAAGEEPRQIRRITEDARIAHERIHTSGLLAKKYAQDPLFAVWADSHFGPQGVLKFVTRGVDTYAQKILDQYLNDEKAREMAIYQKILSSRETAPQFYERYKNLIDRMSPKVLDTTLFIPYMNMVLKNTQ